ncbi:hypothetical protein EI94DRAFT_1705629 [Lactarius quietus]|nr:hypothetical protein EI94DRAFT_1705629 [Lactarius quietus]
MDSKKKKKKNHGKVHSPGNINTNIPLTYVTTLVETPEATDNPHGPGGNRVAAALDPHGEIRVQVGVQLTERNFITMHVKPPDEEQIGGAGSLTAVTQVLAKAMETKETRDLWNSISKDVMKAVSEGHELAFLCGISSFLVGKSWKIGKGWQETWCIDSTETITAEERSKSDERIVHLRATFRQGNEKKKLPFDQAFDLLGERKGLFVIRTDLELRQGRLAVAV